MVDLVLGVTGQSAQQRVVKGNINEFVFVTAQFQTMEEENA